MTILKQIILIKGVEMPRRRIKSKRTNNHVNLKILTDELYDSICSRITMEEMFLDQEHKRENFGVGLSTVFFDKNDPQICKEIWKMHKTEVMKRWQLDKNNTCKRPFLWWIAEAPEPKIKVKRIYKYFKYSDGQKRYTDAGDLEEEELKEETEKEYLQRLNLLEDWEK
jgi:hypothetical protein